MKLLFNSIAGLFAALLVSAGIFSCFGWLVAFTWNTAVRDFSPNLPEVLWWKCGLLLFTVGAIIRYLRGGIKISFDK